MTSRLSIWEGRYGAVDVRPVQPYEATKTYRCPGCHRDIPAGVGHIVAIPELAPDLRRHWHRSCWDRRTPRTRSRTPRRARR